MAEVSTINYHLEEIESIKKYYADLLILQYKSKPRARETIKLGVDIYLGDSIMLQFQDILDIDNAVGEQLNIIGKILDCPRIVAGIGDEKPYFNFHGESDNHGFSVVNQLSDGYFKNRRLHNFSVYTLSDTDYRLLLKFKALANVQRGSWGEMDDILYNMFGNNIRLVNNKNLSITYYYKSPLTVAVEAAIKLKYLRSPIGISVNYVADNGV